MAGGGEVIGIEETAELGVIIAGLQVIEAGFGLFLTLYGIFYPISREKILGNPKVSWLFACGRGATKCKRVSVR